ncbi:hypothetical protein BpHYR1_028455 [Brachionus plicatilis]|uniref:Transposase n=1 Tax=Brachionus plicatilis TaxID=10195 RepID=A0A3M7RFM1_BRAPC|nr:hypothetical protein BpHYR1_028455 [Brachionus plicatilis]
MEDTFQLSHLITHYLKTNSFVKIVNNHSIEFINKRLKAIKVFRLIGSQRLKIFRSSRGTL